MDKDKNVVFFVTSLQSGGIENYLLRFIDEFGGRFNKIHVFCKSGKGGQLEEEYTSFKNVEIIKKKVGYLSVADYLFVNTYFKRQSFQAVCDFTGNFSGPIMYLAKKNNIPKRVVFYRNSSDRFNRSFTKDLINSLFNKLTYNYSTKILSNSKAAFNHYYKEVWKNNGKFQVIYNGTNASKFLNETSDLHNEFKLPKDSFIVGHTGRFNPAKNHATLIKVARELIAEKDDIYFALCGNGVQENLKKEVEDLGLSKRVLLFENRRDIPKFLRTLDCFYFPSITEGQPNSLIEAMVSGRSIVASDIEPIKESVPDDFVKELVPPLNVAKAKENILSIYNGNSNSQKLQSWAIERFNSTKLFQEFFDQL
ncbi:glycosyltransferase [Sphingobacterium lactis]|uniref:glycosyltransferase n=1 Tax=Sphingobacterium lactis TaxID=797291 RepID=UPI003DA31AC4